MTSFTFVGTISEISVDVLKFIENVLTQKFGFEKKTVRIEPVGKIGDNFASQVQRVIVENDTKPFSFLLKTLLGAPIETVFDIKILFKNEILMYELFTKFKDIQNRAGVPEGDQLKFPQCYGYGDMKDFILIEDLKMSNFTMLNKFEPLSNEYMKIVLKKFAIFHSLSYVLKKEEPERYNLLKENLKDPIHESYLPDFQNTYELLEKDAIAMFDEEKYKNVLKNSLTKMISCNIALEKEVETSQYAVISHGDSWTNNIMFQIEDGKPVECILIDYQVSKHRSPVWDLLMSFFNCTDSAARHDHYLEWLDLYHSELDKSLSYFGLKADVVYPRSELDADLKKYALVLFSHAIFATIIVMRKPEESVLLKEAMETQDTVKFNEAMKMSNLDEDTITKAKNTIRGLIDTVLEFDLRQECI